MKYVTVEYLQKDCFLLWMIITLIISIKTTSICYCWQFVKYINFLILKCNLNTPSLLPDSSRSVVILLDLVLSWRNNWPLSSVSLFSVDVGWDKCFLPEISGYYDSWILSTFWSFNIEDKCSCSGTLVHVWVIPYLK